MNLFTKKHYVKYWHVYILGIILFVGIFFRFYNYPYRYNLSDEAVREAVIGIEGARQLQAPLTGGFSSAGPFTWGPWFYYQMILSYLVFPYQYSPFIYLTLTSVFCVWLLYKIGELLYDKTFGFILAFLGAMSPALILSATHLTFPNLTNFFALLSFLLFLKLIKTDLSYWWSFLFGIGLGIAVNIHYQMAGLFILPVLLFIIKPRKYSYFFSICLGVGLTFIPLLLFDLTNHWHNMRNIVYYYTEGKKAIYVPNRWLFYLRDFWPAFWGDVIGTPPILTWISMIGTGVVLALQAYRRKLSKEMILILIAFLVNFILLRYYWGERYFGYLNYLRPFIFIFTGLVLYVPFTNWISKKYTIGRYLYYAFIIIMFISILPLSIGRLSPDSETINMHKTADIIQSAFPDKKFVIYNCEYKGNTAYSGVSHSVLFIFDIRNELDSNGVKIGIKGKSCRFPLSTEQLSNNIPSEVVFPRIKDTIFFDLSKASDQQLQKTGWKKDSFRSIYDSTARWWFREQP